MGQYARRIVYIYTGVLFEGSQIYFIGDHVPVPTHFYKVLYDPKHREAISFLIPHQRVLTSELGRFMVTVDEVERRSGLDFLDVIEDSVESSIEGRKPTNLW